MPTVYDAGDEIRRPLRFWQSSTRLPPLLIKRLLFAQGTAIAEGWRILMCRQSHTADRDVRRYNPVGRQRFPYSNPSRWGITFPSRYPPPAESAATNTISAML